MYNSPVTLLQPNPLVDSGLLGCLLNSVAYATSATLMANFVQPGGDPIDDQSLSHGFSREPTDDWSSIGVPIDVYESCTDNDVTTRTYRARNTVGCWALTEINNLSILCTWKYCEPRCWFVLLLCVTVLSQFFFYPYYFVS